MRHLKNILQHFLPVSHKDSRWLQRWTAAVIKELKIALCELYVGSRLQQFNLSLVIEVLINKTYCGLLRKTGWEGWGSCGRSICASHHAQRWAHSWEPGWSKLNRFISVQLFFIKIVHSKVSTLVRFGMVILKLAQLLRKWRRFCVHRGVSYSLWKFLSVCAIGPAGSSLISGAVGKKELG